MQSQIRISSEIAALDHLCRILGKKRAEIMRHQSPLSWLFPSQSEYRCPRPLSMPWPFPALTAGNLQHLPAGVALSHDPGHASSSAVAPSSAGVWQGGSFAASVPCTSCWPLSLLFAFSCAHAGQASTTHIMLGHCHSLLPSVAHAGQASTRWQWPWSDNAAAEATELVQRCNSSTDTGRLKSD